MHQYFSVFLLSLAFLLTSCVSLTGSEEASRIVSDVWNESCVQINNETMVLKTRYNPLPCDESLKFEVELFGYFRHIKITGNDGDLVSFQKYAREHRAQPYFEYAYQRTDEIYTSSCGQQHYVLVIGR